MRAEVLQRALRLREKVLLDTCISAAVPRPTEAREEDDDERKKKRELKQKKSANKKKKNTAANKARPHTSKSIFSLRMAEAILRL